MRLTSPFNQRLMFTGLSLFSFFFTALADNYIWDTATDPGIQTGSGTWSDKSKRWTTDGTTLSAWPGTGSSASFTGNDGNYRITISGSLSVDSIAFLSGGYVLRNGSFLDAPKVYVTSNKYDTIMTEISGTNALVKSGSGCLVLSGKNTYTGATIINSGTIRFLSLNNGGKASSIGISSSSAANLVINSGNLEYTYSGIDASTDRLFTIGTASCSLNVSMATVHFTNSGAIALDGSGPRTLCVGGNDTAIFAPVLGDKGGATSLQKFGSGTWILTGNNTYTGQTQIGKGNNKGTLQVGNGGTTGSIFNSPEIKNESILRFNRSDTCIYNGVISGNGSLVQGGTGTLILTSNSNSAGQSTVMHGSLIISGSLTSLSPLTVATGATLGGNGSCLSKVIIASGGAVSPGVAVPGKLSVDTIVMNKGSVITFDIGTVSDTLALTEQGSHTLDGTINIRKSSEFTSGTYRIINYAGTLNRDPTSLNIGTSPAGYRCSLSTGKGYVDIVITSDSSLVPRIVEQTNSLSVVSGDSALFFVSVKGATPFSYRWYKSKISGDSLVASEASFSISQTAFSDSGRYFCIVSNSAGTAISDTVRLIVNRPSEIKPHIVEQTRSLSLITGDTARFFVSVNGTPPFSYRWYKSADSGELPVASEASFFITKTTVADSGCYYCIVSNNAGTAISDTIKLSIKQDHPEIKPNLRAEALSQVSVRLAWDKIGIASISVIRIIFSEGTIDTGAFTPGNGYKTINLGSNDTWTTISDLKPDTRYYFALQAGDGKRWSIISNTSKTSCKTLSNKDTIFVNSIVIDTLFFDSQSSGMRITWCTGEKVTNMQTCITWDLSDYPGDTKHGIIIDQLSSCIDTLIRFHPLRFDTLYYVALWFRERNGIWSQPTESSCALVRTGHPHRQVVTLFDPDQEGDTISAFNGKVKLWKDNKYTYGTTLIDTLETIDLKSVPKGMIVVGKPFRFKKKSPFPPLNIGIGIESLPSTYSIHDVRIYSDSSGKLSVNYTTKIDSLGSIVYVSTNNLDLPFMAMIDTMNPEVSFISDTGSYIQGYDSLEDSLFINDNISNVQWSYFYGRGAEHPSLRQQSDQYYTGDIIRLRIPNNENVVNSETGIRAYLLINDGFNIDTINISRRVLRHKSDVQTIDSKVWSPVYPTASLFNKSPTTLISKVVDPDTSGYDINDMRLFRWVSYEDNRNSSEKWVEYNPARNEICSLFTLEPGRIIWLKTRDKKLFHLDSGLTLSLKDTFTLDLPPQQWTDFGMPYRFGVSLDEIFSASGCDSNQVMIYRWDRDEITRIWHLKPLYVPGMPDKLDRSITIDFLLQGGYSIYNNSSEHIQLRIPPTPAASADKLAKSKSSQQSTTLWSVKFIAETDKGTRLSPVYFGYAPGVKKGFYPLCPSFSTLNLSVLDRKSSLSYGHHIDEDASGGLTSELMITNNSDTHQIIRYHLEKTGAFPDKFQARCFDAAQKLFDTTGIIHIAPKSVTLRWLTIGTSEFQSDFIIKMPAQYSLDALYPNPSRSVVNIRYTVPFGAQNCIRIVIFNIMGKQVWEKKIGGLLSEGDHTVSWNGRDAHGNAAASGLYIVRLSVTNQQGEPVRQIDQRIRLMR